MHPMSSPQDHPREIDHLRDLGQRRGLPKPDLTLGFLAEEFARDVAKPMRSLGDLAEIWKRQVPAALEPKTRLVGLSRGILDVEAADAATSYELDRVLREGLERELLVAHRGPALRRVRVTVRYFETEPT